MSEAIEAALEKLAAELRAAIRDERSMLLQVVESHEKRIVGLEERLLAATSALRGVIPATDPAVTEEAA